MSIERVHPLRAVIFDVDGTLADTERDGHRVAFNAAFEAAGLNYRWSVEEYGELLATTGGRRRIEGYLQTRGHSAPEAAALAATLHADKTHRFVALVRTGAMQARPGAAELIDALRGEGVAVAVATTGTGDWVLPLLDLLFGIDAFDVVVTGSDVTDLKPDPAVYLETLVRLDLTAAEAVAIEDSANGVQAAVSAGLRCVAVINGYTRDQDMSGAVAVLDDLARSGGVSVLRGDPRLANGLTVAALRRLVRVVA
ncbi:MAG: phosphatase [Pseudonocardiales bacterium]|nr:HAD-IA family hydrolase [Actinomycetota bacterium]PZS18199.1 MAG: phosphatase [Pseudonocardiales bacterium]